jgi:hypothetical protein
MRSFSFAVITAIAIAVVASVALGAIQQSSANAFATSATRLDHQESVNFYGRGEID